MQPSELDTFLILESDAQRDLYITDFWHRHDLTEGVPAGAFKNMYYERIAEAKERYRSLASDRGRVHVIHGEPAQISIPDGCKFFQPMELWTYRNLKGFEQRRALPLLQAAAGRRLHFVAAVQRRRRRALRSLFRRDRRHCDRRSKKHSSASSVWCRTRRTRIFNTNACTRTRPSPRSSRRTSARSLPRRFSSRLPSIRSRSARFFTRW